METSSLFAPVRETPDGAVSVELSTGHPGFHDLEYRRRRNAIAELALLHQPGEPIPRAEYTEREQDAWRLINGQLQPRHEQVACDEYLDATGQVGLPADRIPQLQEVAERLRGLHGFGLAPAAGLVPLAEFYGSLADATFQSTQYIRHYSAPFYTPEPDVIHELVGHGVHLGSRRFAEIYRYVGQAARRVQTEAALELLSRVFWFTFEYGVMREHGKLKVYGAGLLSSFGEMDQLGDAEVRPLDLEAIARHEGYDVTKYQPVVYCADSLSHLTDFTSEFFTTVDDETPKELAVA